MNQKDFPSYIESLYRFMVLHVSTYRDKNMACFTSKLQYRSFKSETFKSNFVFLDNDAS